MGSVFALFWLRSLRIDPGDQVENVFVVVEPLLRHRKMQGSSKSQLAAIVLVLLWTGGPLGAEAEEVALPSVLELQRAYLEPVPGLEAVINE